MPLYLAYLGMGAISSDKTGLKLSPADGAMFQAIVQQRRQERMKHE